MKRNIVIIVLFAALAAFLFIPKNSRPLPRVRIDDSAPSAWGNFQYKADSVALLLDLTPDSSVVGDLPSVVLVGNKVTLSSKRYWLAVHRMVKNRDIYLEFHEPGEQVDLTVDDAYTVVLLNPENKTQIAGRSYILKATEKNLQRLLEKFRRKLASPIQRPDAKI